MIHIYIREDLIFSKQNEYSRLIGTSFYFSIRAKKKIYEIRVSIIRFQ